MAESEEHGASRFDLTFTALFVLALAALQCTPVLYRLTFQGLDDRWVDSLFRWRGMERSDPRVVIVAMDDESIKRVGQYPWPRRVYGRLLDRLYAAGVKVAGLDILFVDPSRPEEDASLIAATRKAGRRLVHGMTLDPNLLSENEFVYPFEGLRKADPVLGLVNQTEIDGDGMVRRTPLVIGRQPSVPLEWPGDPEARPSMGLAVLCEFLGKKPADFLRSRSNVLRLNIRGQAELPVGYQVVNGRQVQYTQKVFGIRRIPAWKVLEGKLDGDERAALKGGMVLVGSTAQAAFDHYPSPFDEATPGVEVHANLIDNLLHDRELRPLPPVLGAAVALLLAAAALGLLRFLGPVQAFLGVIGLLVAWVWGSYVLFKSLYVPDFTAPTLALLGNFTVLIVHKTMLEQRGKKEIKQMFGQYVAPEIVDVLVKDRSKLKLGGEKRDMTVFFLDIAHFTTISEKMEPEKLILFLNHYLTALSDIILKNKGVVDKYIGDCVMAFWNAPFDVPDHRVKGCLSAVECIEAMARLNKEYIDPTLPEKPAIRIGLNSGIMVAGNTGSEMKKAYTVLGDEVNLASRLEGANKFFGSSIMASESVYQGAKDAVEARVLGQVRVVGKAIPIRVYELLGKKGRLSKEWQDALPHYVKGVDLYLKREFETAKAEFEKVLKVFPEDKPTKLYMSVCDDYAVIPPPADWDGVFNLTAK